MKLVLADTKHFKDSINVVSELVSEAKFSATANGLKLVAMDPANVAMVVLEILSSSFTEYNVKDTEEIAINLNSLKQILRRAKGSEVLTLETTEDHKLTIELKGATKRSFSLPTLEIEDKEQKVPDLKFPIVVKTNSDVLSEAIEDASIVAESVTLLGESDQLFVKAQGDLSKAFVEIKQGEGTSITLQEEGKYKAKYSLEYLKKMVGGAKLANTLSLHFNTDYPLKLEYTVTDRVHLSFILAPRVDND